MINFIKKIFAKPKPKYQSNFSDTNKIEFILDRTEPLIKMSIVNTESQDAKELAELIQQLVTGRYTEEIMAILLKISESDDTIKKFINQTLIYYSLYQTNNVCQNEPVIKPTEFIKQK